MRGRYSPKLNWNTRNYYLGACKYRRLGLSSTLLLFLARQLQVHWFQCLYGACTRVYRAHIITTPPPGRSFLSVRKGGKKFCSDMRSSVILGLSQLSVKTAISYVTVSALIRSILGSRLWTLRCKMLRWFAKISWESELEKLVSFAELAEVGPGFGWMSPLKSSNLISHARKQTVNNILMHLYVKIMFRMGRDFFLM